MARSIVYLVSITYMGRVYESLTLATTKGAALLRATEYQPELYEAIRAGEATYRVDRAA